MLSRCPSVGQSFFTTTMHNSKKRKEKAPFILEHSRAFLACNIFPSFPAFFITVDMVDLVWSENLISYAGEHIYN